MSQWGQPQGPMGRPNGAGGQDLPESAQPTVLRRNPSGFGNQPRGQWGGQQFGAPGGFGQAPGGFGQAPGGFGQQGPFPPPGPQGPGFPPYGGPGSFPAPGPQDPVPPYAPPKKRSGSALKMLIGVVALAIVCGMLYSALGGLTGTRYANDDYQVPSANANPPEIPFPENQKQLEGFLKDNSIYKQTVNSPVRCELPPIDVTSASDAELKAYFEKQMECTMRVWGPAFEKTEFQLHRPTVTIYGKSIQSPCGEAPVNAFYCPANQQLYFSRYLPQAEKLSIVREDKMVDMVMAHEFAHLMQGRTGMTASYMIARRQLDPSERKEGSRRMEVQADCFAGMYLRSTAKSRGVDDKDAQKYLDLYVQLGDDSLTGKPNIEGDHGLGSSRKYWGQLGLSTDEVGKCNAWVAPASQVR